MLIHQRYMVHNMAAGQSSLQPSNVEYIVLFHWSASVKCTETQRTQWTLCSSFTAAAGKLVSSSGSRQHNEASQHFPPASGQLLVDFFLQASFHVPCQAAGESVATRYEPRHQDSASRQTRRGTNSSRSSGIQPHLCNETTVGLSASRSSLLYNWESRSTSQRRCEARYIVLAVEREVLGWKALQLSKGLLLFLDVIAYKCVLFPLSETNLIICSRNF